MSNKRRIPVLASMAALAGLSACASGDRPSAAVQNGVQRVALTAAQNAVIEGGVKQMVERQDGVTISAVTATRAADKPGLQVCGYVATPAANGKPGKDLLFYIELLEKDGQPVAERGQVGSDSSRLSKVTFMCRNNS